ncbi:MAG: hypothetical protein JO321_07295 [Solirubrobacterales bacterium]|nr:hypothetical protein [Solirubrobacterales bacterium]MBV9535198.1 hypothetical protein [Solirubrobacterales bacterium]
MTSRTAPVDLAQPTAPGGLAEPTGKLPRGSPPDLYELPARLTFACECADGRRRAFIARQMDPLAAVQTARPVALAGSPLADVVVRDLSAPVAKELLAHRLAELHNAARDHMVSAFDGHQLHLIRGGRVCSIPDPLRHRPAIIACEATFPLEPLFGAVVRPALQLALLGRGCAAVHAASVEVAGRAVLLAGWSESGKTEVSLALIEQGAAFLSDKWTVLDSGGGASIFPIGVGVRRWALPYLPRLAGSLPPAARRQFRAAALATIASRPVRLATTGAGARGRAGVFLERALAVADRAALTPSELRAAYRQRDDPSRGVPLGLLVLLTSVPDDEVSVRPVSPEWAAARLARAAAYERRDFFSLLQRRAYAEPLVEADPVAEAIAAERRLLEPLITDVPAIEVRMAFPSDPRAGAAAVSRWL